MGNEFLEELAKLCEKHKTEFYYTTDDDGIHIEISGQKIFRGFLFAEDAADNLRMAKI